MADFCRHCNIVIFGFDAGDLRGLSTEKDTREGLFCVVLCESCGAIQVDEHGARISVLDDQDDTNPHLMPGQFVDPIDLRAPLFSAYFH